MPGGGMELGESLAQFAAREVREETGIVGIYSNPGHVIAYPTASPGGGVGRR